MSNMWLIASLIFAPLLVTVHAKGDCEAKLETCLGRGATRPVCGTDNRTYPTRCHLARTRCLAIIPHLAIKHRGKCTSEKQSCWRDNKRRSDGGTTGVYIPNCLPDGSYSPVQCHKATGYCWCVTPAGVPISHTSVKNAKPNCTKKGKTRRGSVTRNQRKDCGRHERSNFLNNLVSIFRTEFNRTLNTTTKLTEEEFDKAALEWKFSTLDVDTNKTLSRTEYKDLRRLVKKILKPRKCARSFIRICDIDRDMTLSHEEWTACLRTHFNPERRGGEEKNGKGDLGVLQGSVSLLHSQKTNIPREDLLERPEESESIDCLTDRKSVLEEQKLGNSEIYVPECTLDGRYQKIQCYKSTGYCWCVHEDTGKPIPGTSVKDLNPKCDAVQTPSRPMKGCPEHRKQQFLKDLKEFLTLTMATTKKTRGDPMSLLESQTEDERIATWNFMALDINKNKVLERKEWKNFRTMISTNRKLRRCGKKLPRYCDINHDRKISLTEWLNCLDAQRTAITTASAIVNTAPAASPSPRRHGLGPMDLLKEYD